jgi:hypothetical protein
VGRRGGCRGVGVNWPCLGLGLGSTPFVWIQAEPQRRRRRPPRPPRVAGGGGVNWPRLGLGLGSIPYFGWWLRVGRAQTPPPPWEFGWRAADGRVSWERLGRRSGKAGGRWGRWGGWAVGWVLGWRGGVAMPRARARERTSPSLLHTVGVCCDSVFSCPPIVVVSAVPSVSWRASIPACTPRWEG